MTMIITETMKTKVVGAEREILHSQSDWNQGQNLLNASADDNGMVAANAKSVMARLKIRRFLGVRTWKIQSTPS